MTELLYFMIWAGIIFLMIRFGCGAHVMGHGRGKAKHDERGPEGQAIEGLHWTLPADDMDPVYGNTVRTETAKPSVHDGHVYYFCSRDCRERFKAVPEQYIAFDDTKLPPTQPENEHA
ncbi:YHS domain-containing protein [Oceanisphaera sp. IT1-181]|uniref:YHS domain-containing protein n=1 Tax=Oceanisphaera sp. IT1-181 TaxID=3081199 RepID=UPI0029C9DCC0|nr:YHS domain-containing protein [Oceanisphaera sp. IT1-181]